MNWKVKLVVVGFLIAGILLIAGWNFIWTPVNKGYCKSDGDCKFTCGCGCIPKNKVCPIRVFCRPTICGSACRCENGECKSWADVYRKAFNTKNIELCKEIKHPGCREFCLEALGLTITPHKREYVQGETVKILVTNTNPEKVSLCRYPALESPIFYVEKFENGNWTVVCCAGACRCSFPCMVRIKRCLELQPNQTLEFKWYQKKEECRNSEFLSAWAGPGRYRIRFNLGTSFSPIYSSEFTIKESGAPEEYRIYLKSREFIPEPGISRALKSLPANLSQERIHVLLQFYHIPARDERAELSALNVTLCSYIPNNAYFASIPAKYLTEIYTLPFVRWIGEILPEDKLSSSLQENRIPSEAINPDGTVNLTVMFFKDVSLDEAKRIISKYGKVKGVSESGNDFVIIVPIEAVAELAKEDLVQWIDIVPGPPIEVNE